MDTLDRIRRFTRFYTARIGLLGQSYVDPDMPLGETRVLYELGQRESWTPRRCAETLGLDEGYLSRICARLESKGLIDRKPSPEDRRVRTMTLTRAGHEKLTQLTHAARDDMSQRLERCPPQALDAAASALETAAALLQGLRPEDVHLRDLTPGDIGWLTQQHGEYYAEAEGFDASFEPLVAEILVSFAASRDPEVERAFIATAHGLRLGSIFCVKGPTPGTAKLRLFYLVPEARGLGIGKRLLEACLEFARQAGYRRMTLWTHESHQAACALYRAYGFSEIARKPVVSFGQELVEVTFEIAL
ncbi:MAG: helix-turn-helix domain-containing GNAT family N-acetyltransferase [Pseudomonadota bacterium]